MFGALPLLACAAHRPGTGAAWAGGLRVFPGGPILVLVFVPYRPGLGASRTPVLALGPGAHPMPALVLELALPLILYCCRSTAGWPSGDEEIGLPNWVDHGERLPLVLVARIVARACCRGSASATPLRLCSCR